ncbi:hypothetical protein [Rhodococcus sp. NPDC058514]|uniref:hypothetical protein n=1 Tax=unclassified Rhodococcus (in: high G+C Gram-positive bacteria) TaxID=192944 RepID=UPI00366198C9
MARTVTAATILALPLGSSAAATANPPPAPISATTAFQVPVTFVSACSGVGFRCWVPHQVAIVTPSATTNTPGLVTFSAVPPTTTAIDLDCIDVSVNWRNLSTGAAGTTALRATWTIDYSHRTPQDEWCRYTPAAAATGSGTVAAVADVNASVHWPPYLLWPQVPVNPGVGVFPVA